MTRDTRNWTPTQHAVNAVASAVVAAPLMVVVGAVVLVGPVLDRAPAPRLVARLTVAHVAAGLDRWADRRAARLAVPR